MTSTIIKMTDRFQVQFDGFAQCSIEHNSDLSRHVLSASRDKMSLRGWGMSGTIKFQNDAANLVLSKLIAQINRQARRANHDRPYFRLLMRDLSTKDTVISTLTLTNCLIQEVELSLLECHVNQPQTILVTYSYETFEFLLGKAEVAPDQSTQSDLVKGRII